MYYLVNAEVNIKQPDGWSKSVSLPTFFLSANTNGIMDSEHAQRIVRSMLLDLGHKPTDCSVYVTPVN